MTLPVWMFAVMAFCTLLVFVYAVDILINFLFTKKKGEKE